MYVFVERINPFDSAKISSLTQPDKAFNPFSSSSSTYSHKQPFDASNIIKSASCRHEYIFAYSRDNMIIIIIFAYSRDNTIIIIITDNDESSAVWN